MMRSLWSVQVLSLSCSSCMSSYSLEVCCVSRQTLLFRSKCPCIWFWNSCDQYRDYLADGNADLFGVELELVCELVDLEYLKTISEADEVTDKCGLLCFQFDVFFDLIFVGEGVPDVHLQDQFVAIMPVAFCEFLAGLIDVIAVVLQGDEVLLIKGIRCVRRTREVS